VGLGFRPEVAADLVGRPGSIDFVEVVAEACLVDARARREALALRELWPVVPHGVKLSLGSADGISDDRARRLGALARDLAAPMVSEHVAFVRAGGREIGHLTRMPYTRAAVRAVAKNVAHARRRLPDVPLLLENAAATLQWPDDEMGEPEFYGEIVRATGCDLLLDVANLHANAVNEGRDPFAVLARFPLEHVAMLHVAGGEWEDGFWFDTHAAATPAPVFELVGATLARTGAVPILLERDGSFPPFADLQAEIDRLRAALVGLPARTPARTTVPAAEIRPADAVLVVEQTALAAAVLDPTPSEHVIQTFGHAAIARTRAVLQRKRVDDMLPLLPRFSAAGPRARALAEAVLARRSRAPERAAITDAWHVATAALQDPELRTAVALDALLLRARSHPPRGDGASRPRGTPFLGRVGDRGRGTWAIKGPGRAARVFLLAGRPT